MSTWDDKPNDYEHALAVIERLRIENAKLRGALSLCGRRVTDERPVTQALALDADFLCQGG